MLYLGVPRRRRRFAVAADVQSGEFYEPEHTTRGPAKLTQLEPISLEADRAALWSASEAAIGEKWEL